MERLGDFGILASLGQGGSGVVYDAQWGPRRVALKVLHPRLVGSERERAQFFAEAQRLAAIGHPHVVKVVSVGALPDGRPYLAMERLEGETLAAVLARGPLPLGEALALFGELCGAVTALHAQGLVHRDLKPENVYVVAVPVETRGPGGPATGRHAVLLDFGIAKEISGAASTVTQDGGVRGTPAYMAPERFFGQPAGVATDLYELAVVLYAMLAGRLPWDDVADADARLSPRPLVGPGGLGVDVPGEIDVELRRALSTRAQNRPASAEELLAAVRVAAGEGAAGPGPKAADTAPMRRDAIARAGGAGAGGGELAPPAPAPWFADRAAGTDRGQTPLAWTSDAVPPPAAPATHRRRWPRALAIGATVAVVGAGAAFIATSTRAGHAGATEPPSVGSAAGASAGSAVAAIAAVAPRGSGADPWADPTPIPAVPHPLPAPVLDAHGGRRAPAVYREELAASIAHLPGDTRAVITVDVAAIMAHESLANIVRAASSDARVGALFTLAPPCAKSLLADADWITYASPRLGDAATGVFLVGGSWAPSDVAECFQATPAPGLPNVWQLADVGALATVDAHVLAISNRADLSGRALAALRHRTEGPAATVRAALAALPAGHAIGIVVDSGRGEVLAKALGLPPETSVTGSVTIQPAGIAVDVRADPHDLAVARRALATLAPQVSMFGGLHAALAGTAVRIEGQLPDALLDMVAASGFRK